KSPVLRPDSRHFHPSLGQDRQLEQKPRAVRLISANRDLSMKLPYETHDDLESEAGSWLVDIESLRQADAMVGNLDVKVAVDFVSGDVDYPNATWIRIFHRVGDEFVDQKAERNGVIGRNQHRIGMAIQNLTP